LEVVLQPCSTSPWKELGLKWLSLKSLFLLAIVSDKRMGELHALLVDVEFCHFLPGNAGVVLRPNPAFHHKLSVTNLTALSNQSPRLGSHWVVDAIQEAYKKAGRPAPVRACPHSTWGLTTTWAL